MEKVKKPKVLLVDDEINILNAYKRNLRGDYDVYLGEGAEQGLEIIKKHGPFPVVVSDFKMPGMNGITFLKQVREINPDTVRIILTGFADINITMDAINEGYIFRFLTKPCPVDRLKASLDEGIKQYRLVTSERELLNKTLKGSIKTLVDILSVVNPLVFNYSSRLRKLAVNIARRLKYKNLWEVEISALVSTIGLVSVPTEITEKALFGLEMTKEEKEMFYSHPKVGASLLKNIPRLEVVSDSVYYQYVDFGVPVSGYKKSGEEIPFPARILKVLNDYFMLSATEYDQQIVISNMKKNSRMYDSKVFGALVAELAGFESDKVAVLKTIPELKEGDVLADDLKDINSFLLLPKGSELNSASISKIINYNKLTKLVEPIPVIES
jgi:response regulator RpfG family c-di-GMP phosphodiesterase